MSFLEAMKAGRCRRPGSGIKESAGRQQQRVGSAGWEAKAAAMQLNKTDHCTTPSTTAAMQLDRVSNEGSTLQQQPGRQEH